MACCDAASCSTSVPPVKVKQKRPDKAEKKVEDAIKNEKVVICGLATALLQPQLAVSIDERVKRTSQRTNLAGLIAYDNVLQA